MFRFVECRILKGGYWYICGNRTSPPFSILCTDSYLVVKSTARWMVEDNVWISSFQIKGLLKRISVQKGCSEGRSEELHRTKALVVLKPFA